MKDKELDDLLNLVDWILSRLAERSKDNQILAADAATTLEKLREYRNNKGNRG